MRHAPSLSIMFRRGTWAAAIAGSLILCSAGHAEDFRIVSDVSYLPAEGPQKLDLYLPARIPSARPVSALIWIHGFRGDKRNPRERSICETLAAAGYVCASINHGPDTAFKSNLLDCKNAVRFLRLHATEYHIDPDRIVAMGGSIGGFYALMIGFTAGEPELEPAEPFPGISDSVRAVVDFYGPTRMPGMSVKDYVRPDGPPVLILQGDRDKHVPPKVSLELAETLRQAGVPHELHVLPGVAHTFRLNATWEGKPLPEDMTPVVLSFLHRHVGSPDGGEASQAAP